MNPSGMGMLKGVPGVGFVSGIGGLERSMSNFSVTSFTTIGFGDVVPTGPVRILCGSEALTGLALITWSASLAFLEMQRDWEEFRRPR